MSKCSRLEREIILLRQELAITRLDRDELYRKLGDKKSHLDLGKRVKSNPTNQDLYIAYLEEQIQTTRLKYKKQMGDVKSSAGLLETKLQNVRQEMNCITAKAHQVDELEKTVTILKAKLQRRDAIIARYNEQHAAFLGLINNLGQNSVEALSAEHQMKDHSKSESEIQLRDDRVDDRKQFSKSLLSFPCLGSALKHKLKRKPD
ncbi:uncharacterized protein LOC6558492 [Drosophila grimshawi]|uniref:GH15266 n=1 Tax=Drosophila grimshawi TaxID=7222 RepID=B4IX20_DROGR|nr:uncharacterized protein LOC6558492 [Drosophila grimshawi]EDV96326.1 GH15266 [Drosophila grimshawi]